MRSKDAALAALVAAAYAALVMLLPMVSFLLWQVRIADALLMLSTVMGWPAVVGVTLGCLIGNFLAAPWGSALLAAIDAALGSVANFIASSLAHKISRRGELRYMVAAAAAEVAVISVFVGSYLRYLLLWAFGVDIPLWLSISGVLPGSIVSIGVLGLALSLLVSRHLTQTRKTESVQ